MSKFDCLTNSLKLSMPNADWLSLLSFSIVNPTLTRDSVNTGHTCDECDITVKPSQGSSSTCYFKTVCPIPIATYIDTPVETKKNKTHAWNINTRISFVCKSNLFKENITNTTVVYEIKEMIMNGKKSLQYLPGKFSHASLFTCLHSVKLHVYF